MRPVSDEPIAAEPERLQRGSYLVNQRHVLRRLPHRARARQHPDRARTQGRVPGRRQRLRRQGLRHVWDPNITPDPETGIGSWKDDEILRAACATASRPIGDFLLPLMPFAYYQHLSDEDARAVVAYLRSVPPYRQAQAAAGEQARLHAEADVRDDRRADAQADRERRPRPIAPTRSTTDTIWLRVALCGDCHSLADKGPRPETDPLAFAGSEVPFEDPGLGKVYASNLTRRRRDRAGPPRRRRDQAGAA